MEKKIALITGANTGIGRATAIELAKKNIKVFLACKSFERTKPVIDFINKSHDRILAEWLELDLSKLRSVKDCADKFLLKNIPLNFLINNAGVAGIRGKTDDGFEAAFGINHLGHFLLTKLLIYKLIQAENSRVVNISSRAHHNVKSIKWDNLQKHTLSFTGIEEYAVSKLANILFTKKLNLVLKVNNSHAFCLHPGVVDTQIWRQLPFFLRPILKLRGLLTPEESIATIRHCLFEAKPQEGGKYFEQSRVSEPNKLAQDEKLAEQLWAFSEKVTKVFQ